jgi:hypothetical protein
MYGSWKTLEPHKSQGIYHTPLSSINPARDKMPHLVADKRVLR